MASISELLSTGILKEVLIANPNKVVLLDIIKAGHTLKDLTDIRFSVSDLRQMNINLNPDFTDYVSKKNEIAQNIYNTLNTYSSTGASIGQIKLVEFIITQVLTDKLDSYSIAELILFGYPCQSIVVTRYSKEEMNKLNINGISNDLDTQISDFKSDIEGAITLRFIHLLTHGVTFDEINAFGNDLNNVLRRFPETYSITEFIITGYSFQSILETSTTDSNLSSYTSIGTRFDMTSFNPINMVLGDKDILLVNISDRIKTSTASLMQFRMAGYTLKQVLTALPGKYSIVELIMAGYFFQNITDTNFNAEKLTALNINIGPETLTLIATLLIDIETIQLSSLMKNTNVYNLAPAKATDSSMLTSIGFTDAELVILGISSAPDLSTYSVTKLLDLRFTAKELEPFGISLTPEKVTEFNRIKQNVIKCITQMIELISTSNARPSEIYFVEYMLKQLLHESPDTYSITELMIYGFDFPTIVNAQLLDQQLKDLTISEPNDIKQLNQFKFDVSNAIMIQIQDIIINHAVPEGIQKMRQILDNLFTIFPDMCSISEFIITGLSYQTLIDGNITTENLTAIGVNITSEMKETLVILKTQIQDPVKSNIQKMIDQKLTLSNIRLSGYTLNQVLTALPGIYSIVDLIISGYFFQEEIDKLFLEKNLIAFGINIRSDIIKSSVEFIHKIDLEILNQFIKNKTKTALVTELNHSQTNMITLIQVGYSVAELIVLGFDISELKDSFPIPDLLAGGFSAADLLLGGILLTDLSNAGITIDQILSADIKVNKAVVANLLTGDKSSITTIVSGLLKNSVSVSDIYTIMVENGILKNNTYILTTLITNHADLLSILTYGGYSTTQLLSYFSKTDLLGLNYSPAELIAVGISVTDPSCFNTGTSILCILENEEEINIKVEDLKVGMNVKSYLHGSRKIKILCKGVLKTNISEIRSCMYRMKETGLILTGGHAILVNELSPSEEDETIENWDIKYIDDKVLLMAAYSDKFEKQIDELEYTYYHFCLENDGDELMRYGVYAEGVLVETPAEKCIKQFADVIYL
jgi:hypothetical protein